MKPTLLMCILLGCFILTTQAQDNSLQAYAVSEENPYGLRNPKAPEAVDDFKPMIGTCDCKSLSRNPDGSWQDTTMIIWTFKYILNGTGIQDETWGEKLYATSLRQYHPDSARWVVSYNSFPGVSTTSTLWQGGKEGDDIVLKVPQKAPNGMEGVSRLTFTNISDEGFDWRGEWVKEDQGIVYPFWLIWCKKRE